MKVGRKTLLGVGSVVAALALPSMGAAQEAQAPLSSAEDDAAAQQQQGPLPLPPEPATLKRRDLKVEQVGSKNVGVVKFTSPRLLKSGGYKVRAAHEGTEAQDPARKSSHRFHVRYPDIDPGQSNGDVR